MTNWHRIDDPKNPPPKDGTHILLHIEGEWIEGWRDSQTTSDGRKWGDGEWEVARMSSHGCGCCSSDNDPPVAWAHLPPPVTP